MACQKEQRQAVRGSKGAKNKTATTTASIQASRRGACEGVINARGDEIGSERASDGEGGTRRATFAVAQRRTRVAG